MTDSIEQITPPPARSLIGMEVIEEITEEMVGVSELPAVEVESKKSETQSEELLPDGTWLKRTVRRTSLQPLSTQASPAEVQQLEERIEGCG